MNRIDAHQHFWIYDPARDTWITNEMQVIKRDFLPRELLPLLQQNDFSGCVAVQADQSEEETVFLADLAAGNDFIKGVVGWIDLTAGDVENKLDHYSKYGVVKGFRHVLQAEPDRKYMLRDQFKKGIGLLQKYNFTYDILIYADQLKYLTEFVNGFPGQKFVIDHLAKPNIRHRQSEEWRNDIRAMAKFENVYCKVSGMITEADWKGWKGEDFTFYLDTAVEVFGINRLMFGSDWPVCLVAGSYQHVVDIVNNYFSAFSPTEQEQVFSTNAITFYNLNH